MVCYDLKSAQFLKNSLLPGRGMEVLRSMSRDETGLGTARKSTSKSI